MPISTHIVGPLQVNCYLVTDPDSRDTAIVDPGMFFDHERQALHQYCVDNKLHITHLLLTHGHFDHAMSLYWVCDAFGILPTLHAADVELLHNCSTQVRQFLHRNIDVPIPADCHTIADGDTINIGSTSLRVIHTPGHTPGGVCFYAQTDNLILTGDTLFQCGIGRTDLPGGNYNTLINSIQQRLFTLPPHTTALPGHGPSTTIAHELHTQSSI